MIAELERFLVLFDRLFHFTLTALERTPPELLDWQPELEAAVRFGTRVEHVTIRNVAVHLAVGEHHWVRDLRDCGDGETIPTPRDPKLTARVAAGDLVDLSRAMHAEDIGVLEGYGDDVLGKSVRFSGRTWTGMGFLWAIYGHRNYHHGNIDLLWRLGGFEAPDYFDFDPPEMA